MDYLLIDKEIQFTQRGMLLYWLQIANAILDDYFCVTEIFDVMKYLHLCRNIVLPLEHCIGYNMMIYD